ncbi:glucokinase [Dehalogenimonas formicexedens]|uniref:Glucokinase n=1 Tax=Dehalogenimonas formicexedens TaxID=1839801 RepID=A0A1P8F5E7_9CHLR|nr:ROK family protein [Dehalogenimonas formicexedens]APV43716.1 glucokinase [Dehalogenimonas formicexedens]
MKNDDNKKAGLTLGVDLGGTKIETALVDPEGKIVATERHATDPGKGPEGVIGDIVRCINSCLGKAGAQAVSMGIGVAGQVSTGAGVVIFAPNLGWRDVPLRSKLEQSVGIPVTIANDVRAATWGEWRHGAGQNTQDLLCLFLGTGIGGGVVSGGRMLEGCLNTAGELGHVPVTTGGRQCHCRNRGCLEAYAGGWAIAERAQEAAAKDPYSGATLIKQAGNINKITALTLAEAFRHEDQLAVKLVEETAEYLATGITGFVNAFNPCLVILGGGIIEGLPNYIGMIEARVRVRALEAAVERLSFVKAALGNDSVVIGAALLAHAAQESQ